MFETGMIFFIFLTSINRTSQSLGAKPIILQFILAADILFCYYKDAVSFTQSSYGYHSLCLYLRPFNGKGWKRKKRDDYNRFTNIIIIIIIIINL